MGGKASWQQLSQVSLFRHGHTSMPRNRNFSFMTSSFRLWL
jgi:hypothetical protein